MPQARLPLAFALLFCAALLSCAALPSSSATLTVAQAHARASDANPGTDAAPFKTISAAAAKAQPGDTILVKPGVYREEVKLPPGTQKAPITLLGASATDRPSIRGSNLAKGPWAKADVKVAYKGKEPVAVYSCPCADYTQIVFADDQPLKQIGPFEYIGPKDQGTSGWDNIVKFDGKSVADMRPGTFFYDKDAKRLYVWLSDSSDPTRHAIEVTARFIIVTLQDYNRIRNFDVRHCQMFPRKGECALVGKGHEIWVENCRIMYSDFCGAMLQGQDHIMRKCELAYNGNCGLTTSFGDRWLVEDCTVHNNNTRRYGPGWQDGGMKVHELKDSKFIRFHAYDEPGSGLWFDISCLNALVAECLFENCGVGLYYEISRWGVIVNNVARDCGMGLWSYSSDVLISNNVVDRCGEGIVVTGDIRCANYSIGYPDPSIWVVASTRNNIVCNNIIMDCPGTYLSITRDTIHSNANWSDYNAFVSTIPATHPSAAHIKFAASWDDYYGRLPVWRMERHFDEHSLIADPALFKLKGKRQIEVGEGVEFVGDPMFVDREKFDYHLKPGSPLAAVGLHIPDTLRSLYRPGIRPFVKTRVVDAPDAASAVSRFEAWGDKHYRYQQKPEPYMMIAPEELKAAPVGFRDDWTKTGKYPIYPVSATPDEAVREVKSAVYDNMIRDPQFLGQTQDTKLLPPWYKAAGAFHSFMRTAYANLADYTPAAAGYQLIGPVKPNTRYTVWGYMQARSYVPNVNATGRFYLASGPAALPEGRTLTPADLTPLGTPAEGIAKPNVLLNWRCYQAVFTSGAAGTDKSVGQGLYVVLDARIEGPGIGPNGGSLNGQVSWDNFLMFCEE